MDLWTEFEGVTIDSAFALNKLLQSEGRSAFFSTTNANGESVLIRIIECHFDEDEILARWRGVETLGHPNFLRIEHFGQFLIEADGITAVYAVFERVDANLGQVLEHGSLSAAEATQIGLSIASALETLHNLGFVHEHVEARNIFAVGESVRLRSDCIRETPEGEPGLHARQRDVHDLATVLMQVLLGLPLPSHKWRQPSLPAPFDHIVRKAMSGEWGLAEIQTALAPPKCPEPEATPVPAAPEIVRPADPAANPLSSSAAPSPDPQSEPRTEPHTSANSEPGLRPPRPLREPALAEPEATSHVSPEFLRRWIGAAAILVFVLIIGWFLTQRWFGAKKSGDASTSSPAAVSTPASPHRTPAAERSSSSRIDAGSRAATEWRVVAFTYNREDQARKKASTLAQRHPDLQPQVFSPTGRAPWLVTVGGAMPRDAAYAMARKAQSLGLPRDTYAQNYTAR